MSSRRGLISMTVSAWLQLATPITVRFRHAVCSLESFLPPPARVGQDHPGQRRPDGQHRNQDADACHTHASSPSMRPFSHVLPQSPLHTSPAARVQRRWPENWRGDRWCAAGRGAARCSTSAGPATGGRRTAGRAAASPRNGNNGGPPTGGTSRVRKAGSIIVTTSGRTAPGAAAGA